ALFGIFTSRPVLQATFFILVMVNANVNGGILFNNPLTRLASRFPGSGIVKGAFGGLRGDSNYEAWVVKDDNGNEYFYVLEERYVWNIPDISSDPAGKIFAYIIFSIIGLIFLIFI